VQQHRIARLNDDVAKLEVQLEEATSNRGETVAKLDEETREVRVCVCMRVCACACVLNSLCVCVCRVWGCGWV
jgi:hypothetical protein